MNILAHAFVTYFNILVHIELTWRIQRFWPVRTYNLKQTKIETDSLSHWLFLLYNISILIWRCNHLMYAYSFLWKKSRKIIFLYNFSFIFFAIQAYFMFGFVYFEIFDITSFFFFSILGLYLKEGKENPTPQITPAKDIFEGQAMRGRNSGRNWKKAVPGQVGTHLSIWKTLMCERRESTLQMTTVAKPFNGVPEPQTPSWHVNLWMTESLSP